MCVSHAWRWGGVEVMGEGEEVCWRRQEYLNLDCIGLTVQHAWDLYVSISSILNSMVQLIHSRQVYKVHL